jgi:hypothetical protein
MSRESLDLVLLMYEAFNRRDLDAFLALMHDEVEIEPRIGTMEGAYLGHEGVRRWWSSLVDFLPDYTAEVAELDDLGEITLGRIRGTAHGAASSTPVVEAWWQTTRWHDGKCIWWRNFATEAEALETIGLETGWAQHRRKGFR